MFFSISEIFDMIVMTLVIGFIFKDFLGARKVFHSPYKINDFSLPTSKRQVFWKDMGVAMAIVAPAIILHEFGHKFVAMAFGFQATFHAAYTFLIIALALKLMNSGFIFIVPAFVRSGCLGGAFCDGAAYNVARASIAIAGPLVNFILWIGTFLVIKNNLLPKKYKKYEPMLVLMAKINFFLMIFNMLPIPGFDGSHFFGNLFALV